MKVLPLIHKRKNCIASLNFTVIFKLLKSHMLRLGELSVVESNETLKHEQTCTYITLLGRKKSFAEMRKMSDPTIFSFEDFKWK